MEWRSDRWQTTRKRRVRARIRFNRWRRSQWPMGRRFDELSRFGIWTWGRKRETWLEAVPMPRWLPSSAPVTR